MTNGDTMIQITKFIEEQTVERNFKHIYRFKNGYGASVVMMNRCMFGTYGADENLWELAVLKFDENGENNIVYDTPITNDVIGWCNDDKIEQLLHAIAKLE